ncbi:haloacid dehalogenase type II [Lichenihabitans psoromatis]|uniref:haloacid dehalogenase type II n=1 Tax=Lichenihabitans psoromatis TaxID=2528642 RepID=UPI001038363A|nr:haloacid dehalogenase type II [Lichenihabitans psoromatis]
MPRLFVFDAYGTLFDVHAAVIPLRGEIGAQTDRLSELWRQKQLEYSWVRALMGRYVDFWAITEAALDYAAARCGGLDPTTRQKLLTAYETLTPYPDARPTLARLKREGCATAILSNATEAMVRGAVSAAGLGPVLDAVLSVDPLRTFKTDPRGYALVEKQFGTPPADVTFVSSNRWDIAGAAAFGFGTVWLNRGGMPDEYHDLPPTRIVASLDALFDPEP